MNKLPILLALILFSCKTRKSANCDAYGYVNHDTIKLTTEHINFEGKCSTDTTLITYVVDTFYIPKKTSKQIK
jgi:hypothetical protein